MKDTRNYNNYKGNAIKSTGYGLVASILQLESDMGRILNNVAYEMAESRRQEWIKCLYTYHKA